MWEPQHGNGFFEVCSTDLKLWQRWLTLWIFVKPLKLSRVELVKCNHHCLRFDGRGELNWQLESVHDFRRNGWYLQATSTVSSVNDTNYWNIRADQSLQNMLKLGTLLHNSRCRKYVGWCRLCRKNQSSGPFLWMIWGRGIPASAIGLNILPRQCGGPQSAVKPVSGQSGLAGLDMAKDCWLQSPG